MKRLAVTGFAILYTVMVMGIAINRTSVWLEGASNRQSSDLATSIDKVKDFVPNHRHARILQNHFVVETPLLHSDITLISDRYLVFAVDDRLYILSPLRIPSRAPPSLG